MYTAIDSLIGGYIRGDSDKNNNHNLSEIIELIDGLQTMPSLDPPIAVLLYSIVQATKLNLKQSDPIRKSIEKSEYLNNLFINILESIK